VTISLKIEIETACSGLHTFSKLLRNSIYCCRVCNSIFGRNKKSCLVKRVSIQIRVFAVDALIEPETKWNGGSHTVSIIAPLKNHFSWSLRRMTAFLSWTFIPCLMSNMQRMAKAKSEKPQFNDRKERNNF
jgi:hypothetical protein